MNQKGITKEDILKEAEKLVYQGGLQALNIRNVATHCQISVGTVYNYFASKEELIFELIASFWKTILCKLKEEQSSSQSFLERIACLYQILSEGFSGFSIVYLPYMETLEASQKKGRTKGEQMIFEEIQRSLLEALQREERIEPHLGELTKEELVEFVWGNMLSGIRERKEHCQVLIKVVKNLLKKDN